MKNIWTVACFEFNRLRRSFIIWIGIFSIVIQSLASYSCFTTGGTWADYYMSYVQANNNFGNSQLFIMVVVIFLYYYEQHSSINYILFSQPIKRLQYSIGKFIGGYLLVIVLFIISLIVQIMVPIFFGELPYSPYKFIESFIIYIIPSTFFYMALLYLINILTHSLIFTVFTYIVFDFIDILFIPQYYSVKLSITVPKKNLLWTNEFVKYLIVNRSVIIICGGIFLSIAVIIYQLKKEIKDKEGE